MSTTTPQKNRKLVSSTQQNQDLASSREALRRDTCEADVVPITELLEAIYGKLEDIADIKTDLEKRNKLVKRGWAAFYISKKDSYQPSDSSSEENDAFQGLSTIFKECLYAAGIAATDSLVELTVHGHENMDTNFLDKTRPDATIHLIQSSFKWVRVRVDHCDVYLYVEFKKRNSLAGFNDDASKLLWGVHHRFRCDPCCRFVCGLTIEDTTARFWHFSRAAVMVSEPFDIMTDPDKLIHIFVASARAKTSADLGFDPTITCITDRSKDDRKYQITIHNNKDGSKNSTDSGQSHERTFITQRIIANYRAVGIRSRGTWVFEGVEDQSPDATPVVIKDVWIDSDREVEGLILENVREALKDSPDELQLFLDPLCHGCVLIDGAKDLTQPLLKSKEVMSLAYSRKIVSSSNTSGTRKRPAEELSLGSVPNVPADESIIIGRRGDRRKHYRIVFRGKPGRALQDLKSYHEVFTALLGGVKALRALHRVGYIHRDLSAGNVLLVKGVEGNDRGVLIDLEYAKRFPDTSKKGHDVRTGTLQFMAVEVNARKFYFPPPRKSPTSLFDTTPAPPSSLDNVTVPWFHNPLHDMESAWWIALWIFHQLDDRVGASLFTNEAARQGIVLVDRLFRGECARIPEPAQTLLDNWLTLMRDKYIELEKLVWDGSHLSFNYDEVFGTVIRFVEAIIGTLPKTQNPTAEGSPNKRQKFEHGQGDV